MIQFKDCILTDFSLIAIKSKIVKLSHSEFEEYVANLFKDIGYSVTLTATRGETYGIGDYGVDLIIEIDGIKTAVQVKHTKSESSYLMNAIKEVVTGRAFYGCDNTMVVTNGPSPKRRIELAEMNNCHVISGDLFYGMAEIFERNYSKKMNETVSKRLLKKLTSF